MSELPLFPLQTVLLPDGLLALRVFEPRYVDMVARCLRGVNRFGVVAIREGAEVGAATTYDYGTSAEIVDWHQEPGGLLGILAAGREPFHVQAPRREPDGLYVGSVTWLESVPSQKLAPAHEPLAALLERLIESVPMYQGVATRFDDAAWVGGRLVELLPLELTLKQSLLETRDPFARLERLAAAVEPRDSG
jgi:Lon protease-like protein